MTAQFPTLIATGADTVHNGASFTVSLPVGYSPILALSDLVFGFVAQTSGGAGSTYTVALPYEAIVTLAGGNFNVLLFYGFAGQANVAATITSSGNNCTVNSFIFRNCKLGNPIGANLVNNGGVGTTASISALTSTANNSLAILVYNSQDSLAAPSWPPSGWTNLDSSGGNLYLLAYKKLTNRGDSTGSVSMSLNGSSHWGMEIIELLGQPTIPGDYWSNGAPNPA
jgi:hypothetical protein